jgi:hypothetical protein
MPRYRVRNWRMYNAALVNRGSLTLWLDGETMRGWYAKSAAGREGHPPVYSDTAIAAVLTMGKVLTCRSAPRKGSPLQYFKVAAGSLAFLTTRHSHDAAEALGFRCGLVRPIRTNRRISLWTVRE